MASTETHDSQIAMVADHMARQLTVMELDPGVDGDLDVALYDMDEDTILDVDVDIYAEVDTYNQWLLNSRYI